MSDRKATLPADHFYFLAHHDQDGSPFLSPAKLAVGLAACLIGEILITDYVTVVDGKIVKLRKNSPPGDPLQHDVYDSLDQSVSIRLALREVALTATDRVQKRMERQRLLSYVEVPKWLGLRQEQRWAPVDPNSAYGSLGRLVYLGERFGTQQVSYEWGDVLITSVAKATELIRQINRRFPGAAPGLERLTQQYGREAEQLAQLASATSAHVAALAVVR